MSAETECVQQSNPESGQFTNEDGTPATWLEVIPIEARRKAFLWRAGIGAAASAALIAVLAWGNTPLIEGLYGIAWALGLGVLFGAFAYRRKEVRRYSLQMSMYSNQQRLRRAAPWWAWGGAILALVWLLQIADGNFAEQWWYPWPVLAFFLVGLGLYRLKAETTLTPAAARAKIYFDRPQHSASPSTEPAEPAQWEKDLDKIVKHVDDSPWLRFPLACACVAGAVYFGSQEYRHAWMLVVAFALFAVVLARELVTWAIGAAIVGAIGWAIFTGLSTLPISAAIIIGAFIIASAMK